ncbi:ABC transporter ATP-binding protein [Polynucleobacter sp. MG-27-Goln-C1]|nr:ABC transporter ATP-binding protein [Polynucleobacter sp. MG-27-Goln-C1]
MSSEDFAIKVESLNKWYEIYSRPHDRLKQFFVNRLAALKLIKKRAYFHEFKALTNVSFEVKKGETVGIIGKNGSGKSTLLQLICQTVTPSGGAIVTNGRIAALLELGAGFNPEFTGRENLYLSALISGLSVAEIDSRISEILSFADIGEFIDQPVKTYSTGMFMRLAFSVQAHIDPEILIIDEALAVGDAFFIHKCMSRFHELKKKGVTILLVTHDSTAIKTLCDRAIWLKNGEVAGIGFVDEVVEEYLADINGMEKVSDINVGLSNIDTNLESIVEEAVSHVNPTSRRGTQDISIIQARIFGDGIDSNLVIAGELLKIRLLAKVNVHRSNQKIIVGYILRNIRGIDIASSNNEVEGCILDAENIQDMLEGSIQFTIPYLHPGQYSLTLAITSKDTSGKLTSLDYCENIIQFNLVSAKECHVLMALPTEYKFK